VLRLKHKKRNSKKRANGWGWVERVRATMLQALGTKKRSAEGTNQTPHGTKKGLKGGYFRGEDKKNLKRFKPN